MLGLGKPVQIAYVVNDLHSAIEEWVENFRAGPFFVSEHIPISEVIYRGAPGIYDHSNACGQWGDIMVELIQDHGSELSVVRDLYPEGKTGLHHLAFFINDIDEATANLDSLGFQLAMSATARPGQVGETRFNFIDAVELTGHFLELYEPKEGLLSFYNRVQEASLNWDGSDPIRIR